MPDELKAVWPACLSANPWLSAHQAWSPNAAM
jgi:hypothetical protein